MISTPSESTLKKYGLSAEEWRAMADAQNDACYVCLKTPTTGRLCIDHEHVKGWKSLSPDKRKLFVRGLLCWVCNHYYLGRGITVDKARNVVSYLERYAVRRPDVAQM